MPQLTIVEASTPAHFAAMSEIHALGWWAAYQEAVPLDWMEEHITPTRWVDTFADYARTPRHHGFLLYRLSRRHPCWLHHLRTCPHWQSEPRRRHAGAL